MTQARVLISGAGPTGLTAALELTRFGIPVRLIDKAAAPSETSRALAVQARTLELMEQRGLAEEMLSRGNPLAEARVYHEGKPLFALELGRIDSRFNFILMLSQAETERILREELARLGVETERPVELVAIGELAGEKQPGAGPVTAVLKHPDGRIEEMETPYLIAAEGAHSGVRHTLNLPFAGKTMEQQYLLADLLVDGPVSESELAIHVSDKGFLGFFPLGQRRFRLIASEPVGEGDEGAEPSIEELQGACNASSGGSFRLHGMNWSSRFRISTRMLQTLREGPIFFGGDAAHVHSPAGGQGMNTGIQDMIDLGWKLAWVLQGKAEERLLETYNEDRLPVIQNVLRVTEQMTNAVQPDNAVGRQLIEHVAPLMFSSELVQEKSTARVSQISFDYRKSSLSENAEPGGGLRGGDRVPEVTVGVAAGMGAGEPQTVRLATLLDPARFTLLVSNQAGEAGAHEASPRAQLEHWESVLKVVPITAPGREEWREPYAHAFGTAPGFYLVRPDSYLALAGGENAGAAVLDWLNKWVPANVTNSRAARYGK